MVKEDIEYIKQTLEFALMNGDFTDSETEHLYSSVCNCNKVLDKVLILFGVGSSKPIECETNTHSSDINKYMEVINEMRLKDIVYGLDYGQSTEDKTLG